MVVVGVCAVALCRDAHAAAALRGHWVQAPAALTPDSARMSTDALPAVATLSRVGGPYWFVAALTIDQPGHYVLDFGSSSTIGRFRHIVIDAGGRVLFDVRGGIESSEPNPFFLRHGRELDLAAGTYRVITEVSSPFLLAEPYPMIAPLNEYRDSIKAGNALVLLCLGMFVALGFYYAALAAARRRAADALYSVFVLGNILYNGTALLVFPDLFGMHWFYLVSAPILVSNTVYIFFVMKLLDIELATHPRLARAGLGIAALLSLFIVVALVRPRWSLELDRVGVAFFISYGLVSGVVRMRQGNPSARLYLVAIGVLFLLGGTAISLTGTNKSYFFVEHLGILAVTAEAILLALVLAHQIATADNERNTALDRAAQNARIARVDALTNLYNRYALEHDLVDLPAEGSLTFIDLGQPQALQRRVRPRARRQPVVLLRSIFDRGARQARRALPPVRRRVRRHLPERRHHVHLGRHRSVDPRHEGAGLRVCGGQPRLGAPTRDGVARAAQAPRRSADVRGEAQAQIHRTEEIRVKPLQKSAVVAAVLATLGLPWVGSVLKWRPDPIPGFGQFPPQQIAHPPGFNALYFAAAALGRAGDGRVPARAEVVRLQARAGAAGADAGSLPFVVLRRRRNLPRQLGHDVVQRQPAA